MNQHSIYALCEPGTLTVRYVGQTELPLKYRMAAHIKKASTAFRPFPVEKWIADLVSSGKKPDCILLTTCPASLVREVEKNWILLFIDNGYDMLNVRDCNNRGKRTCYPSPDQRRYS